MADSNFRGPVNSMGSLEVDAATANVTPLDGPSMFYQGVSVPDIRSAPFAKDGFRPGQQAAWLVGQTVWALDNIPQARNTTQIATTQIGTAALTVAMATVGLAGVASAANIAVGVPIIPLGTSVATFALLALDFGFTTGTTTTNSTTVAVVDNTLFHLGQWLVIGNVGNTAATRSHICQVTAIATANLTGINISPAALTGLASVPIGQANLFGGGLLPPATQFGPAAASANAHSFGGMTVAGLAKVVNPRETLARNISMAGVTAATYSAVVSGWDVWGAPMTEVLTLTAQTTMAGKKAFKYIGSITSGTTSAVQISFGLGDTFGLPFRCDEWDQTDVCWNSSAMTNANGFTAAALVTPSTSTSGDVRGTLEVSTAILTGVIATAISATATNGTSRLSVKQTFGVWNQIQGTPINTVPMFGYAQTTATT